MSDQPGWFSKNWKWLLPCGCVSMIVLFIGFFGAIIGVVFGALKSSDVYQDGIDLAQANPAVIEALGDPVEPGMFLSGSINISGSGGDADISVPLKGSSGTATLYLVATKSGGQWQFQVATVEVDGGGPSINLLE